MATYLDQRLGWHGAYERLNNAQHVNRANNGARRFGRYKRLSHQLRLTTRYFNVTSDAIAPLL
jgi:hypothetical protein